MFSVKILPEAIRDIREATVWYDQQQPGLGKRFKESVQKKVESIKANPHAFSVKYNNTRAAVVETFPFLIHFIIDTTEGTILVVAVLHNSRRSFL